MFAKLTSLLTIDIEKMPARTTLPDTLPRLFWHFLRQAGLFLVIWTFLSSVTAIFNALMPWFGGRVVDLLAASHAGPVATVLQLRPLLSAFAVLCLVAPLAIGNWGQYLLLVVFSPRFGNLVRRQAHWYALRHSIGYFQDDFAGRVANKVQQLGTAIRDIVAQAVSAVLYVTIFVLSAISLLATADIYLVIPMLVWLALYILLLIYFIPRVERTSETLYDAQSAMVGRLVDSYTNIATVKLFARKANEDSFVVESLHALTDAGTEKSRQIFWLNLCLGVINGVMIGTILLLSLYLWLHHRITTGQVAMVLPLSIQVNGQSYWIMWETTAIFEWLGAARDSMTTLARPHTVTDIGDAPDLVVARGAIRFDGVGFHYGRDGGGPFDGLTLDIAPRQKVGLVGHSGAGKSTLVNLLLRFHDLQGGRILVDGQDIAGVTQDSLRAAIGMVTQDTSLLHRSIIDNIRYGRPDASFEDVTEAARRAHAHDFVLGLRDREGRTGYDTLVGERGVKLSGGQRQRIALARILLKDAPILILDEATSALDSEVESYIQAHLATLMEGKTVIAIAHRLSTIAQMDRLIVMEGGTDHRGRHACRAAGGRRHLCAALGAAVGWFSAGLITSSSRKTRRRLSGIYVVVRSTA